MSYHHEQHACNRASNEEIHWYLQDLAKMPVLSLKAEQNVVQQIAAAPDSVEAGMARTLLIEANLRLVVCLASCYQSYGLELADLVQEGNLALTQAAHHFDPQRSPRFGLLAAQAVYWALSHVVIKHLRAKHLLEAYAEREPLHPLSAQVHKALKCNAIDEQAVAFNLPEVRFLSLDVLLAGAESDSSLSDDCSSGRTCCYDESGESVPDECSIVQEQAILIAASLQCLTMRERLVLTLRYLLDRPQTLEEVGWTLGVTGKYVRQIEEWSLGKVRYSHGLNRLRCHLS